MKTIIGTQTDVIKELTAQVADALARKPEANIAISAVDLPAEVLGALAASDIAFDKATLFRPGSAATSRSTNRAPVSVRRRTSPSSRK